MLNKILITVLILITLSCERSYYIDNIGLSGEEISSPKYPDNFNIIGSGKFLGFDSNELFDTSYYSYYGNMCSSPTEYFTFSNSDYLCQDTFDLLARFSKSDTMLLLKVNQEVLQDSVRLDNDFIDLKINIANVTHRASASNVEIIFDTIQEINNINFAYYIFVDTSQNEITESGLNAYAVVDNVLISILCKTYKTDAIKMIEKFKSILNSFTFIDT